LSALRGTTLIHTVRYALCRIRAAHSNETRPYILLL